jgi:hypothetical protein
MSDYCDPSLPPIGGPTTYLDKDGNTKTVSLGDPIIVPTEPVRLIGDLSIPDPPRYRDRVTIFMLLYGNYIEMHRQSLAALIGSTTSTQADIRVGSNQLGSTTTALIDHFIRTGRITRHYMHVENDKKYPVMREMFHDKALPITTDYVVWFDDDSVVLQQDWLQSLLGMIKEYHPKGVRLFGPKRMWTYSLQQIAWVKQAPWYRGRPFQDNSGRESPNGDKVFFASGGFWALASHVIREQDIPDVRIGHNGGDYNVAEQVWQGGWSLQQFSTDKSIINWSAYKRRGLSEKHAGL